MRHQVVAGMLLAAAAMAGDESGKGIEHAILPLPVHGERGWTLAKYEWRKDGTGRFLYVRNNGERREVIRTQTGWCV